MRWSDRPAELPLQPLASLGARTGRTPGAGLPREGLLVIVSAAVRADVLAQLGATRDEQGGLLLGEVFAPGDDLRSETSRAVVLRRAVPALDFSSSGISLRMESGVWDRARLALGPLELIVGWYHSHPGLGAFFSATDRRTQAAFFPHAYSVGWVVDPLLREEAFFVGRDALAPGTVESLAVGSACVPEPSSTE